MEFRVLGPLEIVAGERAIPLRGEKQRALLAALLVRANEVVPEDVLLEELWGETQPGSGKAALRVRVSQLRRSLGEAGERVVTRAPGYVLEADGDEVDASRFEALLGEGRAALRAGDPARAATILREALGLWRGPAFAEVAYESFARNAVARLGELRLTALEELMDAELSLGRHAALVGELEALVAEHPLRERFRGQLMTALYRSGRQAEALAVYRTGRETLAEELGIDPGDDLQELERAIHRRDPALDLPGRPSLPAARPARDEHKLVTVLAVGLGSAIDEFRAKAEAEIALAGGRIEVVGETITAAFGVPVSHEDDAVRALSAALAIRRAERNVHIGVESGDAVFAPGDGGSSVAGAAVEAATTLAQSADPGMILVGPRALAATAGAFAFGSAGELLHETPTTRRPGAGQRAALVGRSRELAALEAAYGACVADGRPYLVTVAGDAGVGKTRLVRELGEHLAGQTPEPRVRSGRCVPYGRAITYQPLGDVLRQELGLLETDEAEVVLERLGDRRVLGLTLGLDTPDVHPLAARERLEEAWVAFFGDLTAEGPAVVLLEDLHWAQDALLDLVERLHAEVPGPLLLVGTARPELLAARPAWGRRQDALTVWLEPLPREEAEQLLALVGGDVPEERRSEVLDRAEGNPFFLEELAQAAAHVAQIPDSVQGVLAGRIDLLPPTEKAALQAGSVIGRIFWRAPLVELLDGAVPDLELLEARDFIRRRSGSALEGEREFAFKHALTWEVAYGSLTSPERVRLHARFAEWLEDSGGGRDEHAALLAQHYADAAHDRAVHWLLRASELAVRRYELEDAIAMLQRALELTEDESEELAIWRRIGRAQALRHDGDAFLDALERAIALSRDRATTAELYADLAVETAMRTGMWRRRPERELVDGWIDRALELAEPDSASRARALIARCVWAPDGSAEAAREASEIAERLGDPELRSYAWDARGITSWVAGEPDLGRAFEERRFELLDQIQDPDHVADIHYAPITGCVWLGYFGEARRLADKHNEIVGELTPHHRIHGLAVQTELEELAGGWEAIDGYAERVETVVLANRDTPCMRSPRILLVSAVAALRLGDAERARELEAAADDFGIEGFGHTLDTPRIRLALLRGDLATAETLVAEPLPDRGWHRAWLLLATLSARLDAFGALGRTEDVEAWQPPRRGTYLEPFWLRALGLVHGDEEQLLAAIDRFEKLRLKTHAAETRAMLDG